MQSSTDSPQSGSGARGRTEASIEARNLASLVAHHVLMRVAWIFKTESVIMPVFLDAISGEGWIRGCLPVLNRVGQSVPPLLLADKIRAARSKRLVLASFTAAMGLPFLALAGLWWALDDKRRGWVAALFLILYFAFFAFTGVSQLAHGAAQGKLIPADRRGRLLGRGGIVGSIAAIVCALLFLWPWLELPGGGFERIFAFSGGAFVLAAAASLLIVEPLDEPRASRVRLVEPFVAAVRVLRTDRPFRRAAWVAMLSLSTMLAFPHYQALARTALGAGPDDLLVWVVAQNAGAGIVSHVVGRVADRLGTRAAVRLLTVGIASTPLIAVALAALRPELGRALFWIPFVLLGQFPVTMKALMNHTLELAAPEDQPSRLATLNLCFALPFAVSPLVGWLVDAVGFAPVFVGVSLVGLSGAVGTLAMSEPRHRAEGGSP